MRYKSIFSFFKKNYCKILNFINPLFYAFFFSPIYLFLQDCFIEIVT